METNITDGKINLKGNFVTREKPKRADYMLYLNANNPIAIIEAFTPVLIEVLGANMPEAKDESEKK